MCGRILTEPADLRALLDRVRTIAVVGVSTEWKRPSSYVMKYLQSRGYRTIPVNPRAAGEDIWGERVYASLSDIPDRFDMVDIFRNSATRATAAGLDVVMDRCAKIEYGRHHSELSWGGFNTGLISAKRARVRLA
jgi:predicted CoA-binding protein